MVVSASTRSAISAPASLSSVRYLTYNTKLLDPHQFLRLAELLPNVEVLYVSVDELIGGEIREEICEEAMIMILLRSLGMGGKIQNSVPFPKTRELSVFYQGSGSSPYHDFDASDGSASDPSGSGSSKERILRTGIDAMLKERQAGGALPLMLQDPVRLLHYDGQGWVDSLPWNTTLTVKVLFSCIPDRDSSNLLAA